MGAHALAGGARRVGVRRGEGRAARVHAPRARRRARRRGAAPPGPRARGAAIWRNFFLDNGLPVPAPRKITCEDLREDEYFGKPKRELDDDEVHEAYYDDLRYEAYLEKASERGLL